ncbi:MAG: hypothetical protein Q4Q00_04675 [Turicibacter sp.]|nr:hypothetical protein [Turicibacter sp.]
MPNENNALESKIEAYTKAATGMTKEKNMKAREIQEKIRKDWLQKPNLTGTELEYLNNYFYDGNYFYCEECDMIDHDSNWFWYDDDEYTDYLHIKCNKDKYSEQ